MTIGPDDVTVITTSEDVQNAMVAALEGKTGAGDNIYTPRTWPVKLPDLPVLLIKSPKERKESPGPNTPAFTVSTVIRVIARLTFKALVDDAAAAAALDALAIMQRQIEVAVINNFALFRIISEISSVDTENEVKSEGNQSVAELTMDFTCKFYQGPECFAQPDLSPFTQLAVYGDLLNVFDANGTYAPPFDYPVPAEPRSTGPDGRVEGAAIVDLPQ